MICFKADLNSPGCSCIATMMHHGQTMAVLADGHVEILHISEEYGVGLPADESSPMKATREASFHVDGIFSKKPSTDESCVPKGHQNRERHTKIPCRCFASPLPLSSAKNIVVYVSTILEPLVVLEPFGSPRSNPT